MKEIETARLILEQNCFHLPEDKIAKLVKYALLLISSKVNVISKHDLSFEKVFTTHIVDSLFGSRLIEKLISQGAPVEITDLGSGGGLPGIPLKILFENLPLNLIDSNKKKILFMGAAAKDMGMENVVFINKHTADLVREKQKFKLITVRGVNLEMVSKDIYKLLNPNGYLMAWTTLGKDEIIRKLENRFTIKEEYRSEGEKRIFLLKCFT